MGRAAAARCPTQGTAPTASGSGCPALLPQMALDVRILISVLSTLCLCLTYAQTEPARHHTGAIGIRMRSACSAREKGSRGGLSWPAQGQRRIGGPKAPRLLRIWGGGLGPPAHKFDRPSHVWPLECRPQLCLQLQALHLLHQNMSIHLCYLCCDIKQVRHGPTRLYMMSMEGAMCVTRRYSNSSSCKSIPLEVQAYYHIRAREAPAPGCLCHS